MFYQIPEILINHEFFLQQLQARVKDWHDKQKIGDIFVSSVRTFSFMSNNVFVTLSFFTPSRSTGTPAIWQVAFLNNWCFCGDRWLAYDPPNSQKYSRTFIIPMLCSQSVGPFKSLLSIHVDGQWLPNDGIIWTEVDVEHLLLV